MARYQLILKDHEYHQQQIKYFNPSGIFVGREIYLQEYQQQKTFTIPEVTSENRHDPYDKSTMLINQ